MQQALFSSRSDDWSTPQKFYDQLHAEFDFNLDPAATDTNHKCPTYYTPEQDGLKMPWTGYRAFCNPPYGREIGKWVEKAYNEAQAGALVVMLLPARTDTGWWHDYVMKANEIRYIRGRLKFGDGRNSAPFPSAVVIFKPKYIPMHYRIV